jgi:2-succinyl-6-hydroxy-2,4-cyclohexadiene-1-carboxylate synthase
MAGIPIEITRGFVSSGAERIYYESAGQGDAIIFCHGLGGNHASWFQQIPVFARSYRTIIWDQRGFGRSTNCGGECSPALAVTDLKALVDMLEIRQAHVIGQSMGGWAAVGFALAYPERVQSLVLADTFGGIYTAEIEQGFTRRIQQAEAMPPKLLLGYHPAIGAALTQRNITLAYLYQQLGSFGEPTSVPLMFKILQKTSYSHETLRKLSHPVLCLVRSEDPLIPPALLRQAAVVLPNAQVVEIPGTGHSPYFEEPDTWNQVVLDFLSSTGSSRHTVQ